MVLSLLQTLSENLLLCAHYSLHGRPRYRFYSWLVLKFARSSARRRTRALHTLFIIPLMKFLPSPCWPFQTSGQDLVFTINPKSLRCSQC